MSTNFNCSGRVNINDFSLNSSSFFLQREVNNVLNKKKLSSPINFKKFNCQPPGIFVLQNLKHYVMHLSSQLKFFERNEKLLFGKQTKGIDYFSIRQESCEFIFFLRNILLCIKEESFTISDIGDDSEKDFDDLISYIQRFLKNLQNVRDSVLLTSAQSVGNKCNQPEYHWYHVHLDLRWLLISLTYIRDSVNGTLEYNSENLENKIIPVMKDLIYISLKIFENIPLIELKAKSPHTCTCLRELYLMLQIFIDNLFDRHILKQHFLFYINSILNEYGEIENCKSPELFRLWLIYHLTLLYGYNNDGVYLNKPSERFKEVHLIINQVEKILKSFVNKGGKEGARESIDIELSIIIQFLYRLNTLWFKINIQIISYLYDCFHKRLDQPFLVQSRGPWITSVEKKTPIDVLKEVRERIAKDSSDTDLSSFGFFLRLLGTFLLENDDQKTRNQMKSRILSRFTENKVREFSEQGIYNFASLFLTMAVTTDTINVCSAMINLLPSSLEWTDTAMAKKSCLIWKCQLIVLILYNEQKLSFEEVAESFTEMANKISCRKDEYSQSMMSWFIDVIRLILIESEDFSRSEYKLIGGWVDRHILENAANKVEILLSLLLHVFQKCNQLPNDQLNGKSLMLNALWKDLAGRIRLMVTICDFSSNFYENPTRLAAAFTAEACRDPDTAKKHNHTAISLFQHFASSPIVKDSRITRLFLTLILRDDNVVKQLKNKIVNFNNVCIQAFIKCSVLNLDSNSETNFFKNYISNLPEIRKNILTTDEELREFLNSREPLINFLTTIAKRRNFLKTEQQCASFDDFCRPFFQNIDKWILQLVSEENKNTKLSFWIYKCIGSIILCCSPILYIKNNPKNPLKLLINKIALGPEPFIIPLSQRIFGMIILGIENLNFKSDISVKTIIRELFEKFLPTLISYGATENSVKVGDTLFKCFVEAKLEFVHFLIDTLTSNFITTPSANKTHSLCYMVMLLLIHLVKSGKVFSTHVLESIISLSVPSVIKAYLKVHERHPHKLHSMDFIKEISLNTHYRENALLRDKLNQITWSVLKDNIHNYSKICFDFLNYTYKVNIRLYNYLAPLFEEVVTNAEKNKLPNAANLKYILHDSKRLVGLNKVNH